MMNKTLDKNVFRLALILGFFQALGPLAIDLYLPGLPLIASEFNASAELVQLSLTSYFLAMCVGQLIFGSLSDMYGRVKPLLLGFFLFFVGSIGCAISADIETLVLCRMIQGAGASAVSVIPRAIVRDLFTGLEAVKLMNTLMLVFSVSPMLAPLLGSYLIDLNGWRCAFFVMSFASSVGAFLLVKFLKETMQEQHRISGSLLGAFSVYWRLLQEKTFMGIVFVSGLGMSAFMIFLASSSFVFTQDFGLTAREFSFAFALNAISFVGGPQVAPLFVRRFGVRRLVQGSLLAFVFSSALLWLLAIVGVVTLPILLFLLFVVFSCLGVGSPYLSIILMDRYGEIAGSAAALMGALNFSIAALVLSLLGWLVGTGSLFAMVTGIACCALASCVLCFKVVTDY